MLVKFVCNYNQLINIDLRNGNNSNVYRFYSIGNPNLYCIYVDDKNSNYLLSPTWFKDTSAYWVSNLIDCQTIEVAEYALENSLLIYPNPNNGNFTIDTENYEKTDIYIYTIRGKLILKQLAVAGSIEINLSNNPKGIYIINIETANNSFTKKLIKN